MDMARLDGVRKKVDQRLTELKVARQRVRSEQESLNTANEKIEDVREAQTLAQQVAQQIQQQAHDQIAGVVSRCLETVFDDPYEFRLIFRRQRGRTEVQLIFVKDGEEMDPLQQTGGGVVDVAAFALRLSCLMLRRPPLRRFLALDEPFKFLHPAGRRERMRALLESLSEEMGVQMVIVTGIKELHAGTVVEFPL